MAKQNYERLDITEFGKHLLMSGDLDPVYIALQRLLAADLDRKVVYRWLVAYWCLYQCGAASYVAEFEGQEFWDKLLSAANNDNDNSAPSSAKPPMGGEHRWPRGHERRHFRGVAANNAVCDLMERYEGRPEEMVERIMFREDETQPLDYKVVADRVKEHKLFGPWIAFKVADMVDRVLGVPVDFSEAAIFMFKDPVKSALMQWRLNVFGSIDAAAKPKSQAAAIHNVVEHLRDKFHTYKAPPYLDRPVGLQEIETILCKWKSHMNGHYPMFNDIDEIDGGMDGWVDHSELATHFRFALPRHKEGHWRHA